ncbi:MAG TPA: hypothetical protein VGI65_02695 [Steroidobacteraceae bacterium]|jgi:hypothetical protein
MRMQKTAIFSLVMLTAIWSTTRYDVAAAADDQYVGTWKGSWEGGGASGRFDLTFARGSDGKLTGSVSVGTDMGDYKANFSTVSVAADKLTGAYDYPPDPQGEVTIAGSFDPKNAAGTWSLGAKGQPGQQAIAGTWKVSKQ